MLRRTMIAALLVAPLPALAAAPNKEEGAPKEVGQHVDLLPVALPIVADGRLVNYVFVYVRIDLTRAALPSRWRAKEPQFRDVLVRAGHRTPFTLPNDYSKIDERKLAAAMLREGTAITGPGQIKSVVVTSQQPRRRVAAPRA